MADVLVGNNMYQYDVNGTTYLEFKDPWNVKQNNRGGLKQASGFMVIPGGGGITAVRCAINLNFYVRVKQNLDAQVKITPEVIPAGSQYAKPGQSIPSSISYNGSNYAVRGIYSTVYPSSHDYEYMMLMMICPFPFTISAAAGGTALSFKAGSGFTTPSGYTDIRLNSTKDSNPSAGITIFRKKANPITYSKYYGTSPIYNKLAYTMWYIGSGESVDSVLSSSRFSSTGTLSDSWKKSTAWTTIGNLEKNFGWVDGSSDGYLYVCGTGYYSNMTYTYGSTAQTNKIRITGLKKLLNYYPWAIKKDTGWESCNRSGGHLQSCQNGTWVDRKNRMG